MNGGVLLVVIPVLAEEFNTTTVRPARGVYAFSTINRFSIAFLYGRAGYLAAVLGVCRSGQEVAAWTNIAPIFISAMIGTQMGRVADTYGRARTWHVGMALELVSHAVCGWAQSMPALIAGRVCHGRQGHFPAGRAFFIRVRNTGTPFQREI